MTELHNDELSRRDFLQLGVTVTAGVVLPSVLAACGGGGGEGSNPGPTETFKEPLNIQSANKLLDVTIILSYLTIPFNGTIVTLRNMFGSIPAPTLRMSVGDTLRIKIINRLPTNPPDPTPTRHLRYHNSTNLHVHGLHVYPDIYPQPAAPPYPSPNTANPPLLYGDFVVDDPDQGIQPGEERQYEYYIRDDHPAGTYWYHPHLHGSSAMQVGSGMAGALIIEGPIDDVPQIAAATEKVFVFQAPIYDPVTGQLSEFAQVANTTINEPPFLINGVRKPRIVMFTGEVQNWRFINAAIFKFLNLSLERHALYQYSHDGNPRRTFRVSGPVLPVDPNSGLAQGIVLAPANRSNVLVKAGAPGTYLLKTLKVEMGRTQAIVEEDVLAEIVVVDNPLPMNLPPEPLPVTPFLNPITDAELAASGGIKRTIVMRVIASATNTTPPGRPFEGTAATPLVQPPPGEYADWLYQTGNTQVAGKLYALGSDGTTGSQNPGMPSTYIPFQSSKSLTQTVALNSVEECTIINMNNIRHPFHIHVNPMYVVAVNGVKLAEPYWADTVPLPFNDNPPPPGTTNPPNPKSVTFRMRFLHYTGRYVMHCHMLVHEDMGMMQGVTVV
ncbi:MAG: multicopper oxidase domain-containing protein [Casimicrobiaceae bacterium]